MMYINFQVSTLCQKDSKVFKFIHPRIIEPSKASSEAQGDLCRAPTRNAAHFDTLLCLGI